MDDAKKPVDGRIKTGIYCKTTYLAQEQQLPLPIGVSDYRLASTEYYYIDKTMMIKEFIDERPLVTLFTRPRRFVLKIKKSGHADRNTGIIRANIQ